MCIYIYIYTAVYIIYVVMHTYPNRPTPNAMPAPQLDFNNFSVPLKPLSRAFPDQILGGSYAGQGRGVSAVWSSVGSL